jgi:purine/pyrimidine-nucleoside phosphorylase
MAAMPHPSEFPNATVLTRANVYFDGRVVSHTVRLADGSKKTLGLIYPGEYHFDTQAPERMDITAGTCRVRLAGEDAWQEHGPGGSFKIPGSSGFDIVVESGIAQYICSFG